ncbi:hypothetical protein [Sediminicurvatus halobius]|uniref:Uncharacterized protein n=1 Tax=Sediminicurvatus halobius TaxID=2182432 RepID=A0A2U2N6W8_9GAMM|nr:hypothetical protein [Spiribacter halobius]PWG64936.1 hypothetical protein DEM34_03840 [Spiribacter halobius]UEX78207.1 hypothetical protein LMH63_00770 [Spiribacter halobius]
MADLQQVIGALLRDLAKARFASDLYSRSIARYYEGDFLLRKFPVPRADIAEVEVDLKFSITEVKASDVNTEGREANVAFLLERSVEELVATYLDLARDYSAQHPDTGTELERVMSKGFNSTVLRIELRQHILRYFIESYTHLIRADGSFDAETALRGLRQPMFWAHANHLRDGVAPEALNTPLDPVLDFALQHDDFRSVVTGLDAPIREIWHQNSDVRLEVDINGHTLAQLQEAAISSIRVRAEVRNSVWTEVKTGPYSYQRSLTPE